MLLICEGIGRKLVIVMTTLWANKFVYYRRQTSRKLEKTKDEKQIVSMASNFSANQFEKEFKSKSLCNWEVPHWYPKHPRRRTTTTNFIANDRGHLLPNVERPKSSPWGRFQNTWQLPAAITREQANEINAPPVGNSRWALADPQKSKSKSSQVEFEIKKENVEDLEEAREGKLEKAGKRAEDEKPEETCLQSAERLFSEKEKLNSPLAIAQQSRRKIRHETLERDDDEH